MGVLRKTFRIPVAFISELPIRELAVNEAGFRKMLGYDDGRSEKAARQASWRFRVENNIRTLPGGVYSIFEIQDALKPRAPISQNR